MAFLLLTQIGMFMVKETCQIEKYIAIKNGKIKLHQHKWYP